MPALNEYSFTLWGTGPDATPEVCDRIARALGGEPDVSVSSSQSSPGLVRFDFDREHETAAEAVATAEVDLRRWGYTVVGSSPGPLCTIQDIADELDRTHASVAQLVRGDRGPGEFPAPFAGHDARSRVFRWLEVMRWLEQGGVHQFDDTTWSVARVLEYRASWRLDGFLGMEHAHPSPGLVDQLRARVELLDPDQVRRWQREREATPELGPDEPATLLRPPGWVAFGPGWEPVLALLDRFRLPMRFDPDDLAEYSTMHPYTPGEPIPESPRPASLVDLELVNVTLSLHPDGDDPKLALAILESACGIG